jgi:hypothetical protein
MNLEELKFKENLSIRTYNVCNDNELHNIQDIIEYYRYNGNFKQLRNCGVKSDQELIHLCEKYMSQNDEIASEDNLHGKTIDFQGVLGNPFKLQKLQISSNDTFNRLSNRAKNTILLSTQLKSYNVETIVYKLIVPNIDFKNLQNCGDKTAKEIQWFVEQISGMIKTLNTINLNEEDVVVAHVEKSLGQLDLGRRSTLFELIKNKELNLIYFVEKYILKSSILNVYDKEILKIFLKRSELTEDTDLFIKAAEKLNLTRERVRQLFVKFKIKTVKKLSILHTLVNYSFDLETKTKNQNWKIQHQPLGEQIILLECKNDAKTLANLLDLLATDNQYYIISGNIKLKGKIAAYDQQTYKKFRHLNVKYLIQESFISKSLLLKIFEDLYLTLIERINQDTYFNLTNYNLNDDQRSFVIKVCAENFGLNVNGSSELILKRNTIVTAPEIIEGILIDFDELMTAEEILEEYRTRHPHANKEINSIRGALNNERFIFFRGSGSSRYGLKEWEKERGLKSGNIKTMCQEYIESQKLPVHIFTLTKYVQEHRNTNQRNVLTNLKLDNTGQFRFFPGGFIGIIGKDYPSELISRYRAVNPFDANMICYFIKNHWYYDYHKTINKFCNELRLMPPQVENLLELKINEGILKIKNNNVYYNQVDEDALYDLVFSSYATKKDYDFNPYRIEFENLKLICRITVLYDNQFLLTENSFLFTRYDLETTDFRCLLYYQKSHKSFIAIIWKNDEEIEKLIGQEFFFSDEKIFEIEELHSDVKAISFTNEKINSFKLELINTLKGNTQNDNNFDLSYYNISGLNKMEAFSRIIEVTESKYNKVIDLTEAKRIFELLNSY